MITMRDRSLKDDATFYRLPDKLEGYVKEAGIPYFRIINEKNGLWVEIKKKNEF